MDDIPVPVEVPHERDDAAFEVEGHLLVDSLVANREREALGEVRPFAEPGHQEFIAVIVTGLEDLDVGKERRLRAMAVAVGLANDLDIALRLAAPVFLPVDLGIAQPG